MPDLELQRRRLAEAIAWNTYVARKTGCATAAGFAEVQRIELDTLDAWWASRPVSA